MCVHAKKVGMFGMIAYLIIEMECVYMQNRLVCRGLYMGRGRSGFDAGRFI